MALVFGEGEFIELFVGGDGGEDDLSDDFVGFAEGKLLAGEVVGQLGGIEVIALGGGVHAWGVELEFFDDGAGHSEAHLHGVDGIEEGFFVFLEVLVVAEREALEYGGKGHIAPHDTSHFAANEFHGVGIFLLGHDGRTGGDAVAHLHEAEFCRGVEDKVFGEAAEVHHEEVGCVEHIQHKVPVADGIHAVAGDAFKTELLGEELAIDGIAGSGHGSGA